ncbi:MAG: helix-turn-helix transcriptional regulator [Nocardioides sp.]|uniref:helix-turn-helix domain-containing protein n=1 Tax=Nocardioides sp. TaxID=35761 RepID=UPI0039E36E5F
MSTDKLSLGAALRAWRDRLAPEAVGRQGGRDRRTPGLRREDLADLAGLSVDYVVRLEQGRATRPSAQVAGALARALQLSGDERDHLYRLAGLQPPSDGIVSDHVPPGLQRILARLGDAPAAVFAADWQLVTWNDGWRALLGDPATRGHTERNLVRSRFLIGSECQPLAGWPVISTQPERTDRAVVADLRRASGRYPDDPRLASLVHEMLDASPRFAELWHEGGVAGHAEDRKTIHHPVVGEITVDCDILVDTQTDLKIVIYTAVPGSEDASRLELAMVVGASTPA